MDATYPFDYGEFFVSFSPDTSMSVNDSSLQLMADELNADDDDLFRTLDTSLFDLMASSNANSADLFKMDQEMKVPDMGSSSRFSSVTEEQLHTYEHDRQSKSTKSNTKWAIRIFQGK